MRRDDPAALAEFLNDVGLERHCATLLSGRWRATLGGLLVLIEERPVLLARLKELGVSQLSDRQCLANALARLQRSGADSSVVLDPAVQLPIFDAPGLVSAVKASDAPAGHPSGTHGLLLAADGTASHVNSHPPMRSDDGSHCWITHGTRLDGPIVAAVTRLASRLGRAVFLPFSDEDPGLATPHSLHSLAAASPPEGGPPKRHDWLAAMAHAFGPHVLVLTTALHRGVPSHPRVRLMPCFDSWAASTTELPSAAARARPFASRTDRAVWRGVPSGSQALVRDGASIRSRVLDYCAGKPWADCQYGGGMMHGDNWLTLDELAAHKVILASKHRRPKGWIWPRPGICMPCALTSTAACLRACVLACVCPQLMATRGRAPGNGACHRAA